METPILKITGFAIYAVASILLTFAIINTVFLF